MRIPQGFFETKGALKDSFYAFVNTWKEHHPAYAAAIAAGDIDAALSARERLASAVQAAILLPVTLAGLNSARGARQGGTKRAGQLKHARNPAAVRAHFEREIARHGKHELAIERTARAFGVSAGTVRNDLKKSAT